jgi:hypothetical protein
MIVPNPNYRSLSSAFNPRRTVHRQAGHVHHYRPPLSLEDIRLHALLNERLAALHRERHGLWPTMQRFLWGKRLVRWLFLAPWVIVRWVGNRWTREQ